MTEKKIKPEKEAVDEIKEELAKDFVEIELDDGVYLFTEAELKIAKNRTKRYKIERTGGEPTPPSSSTNEPEIKTETKPKPKPPIKDLKFKGNESVIHELLYGIRENKNILLTGHSGTGKTTLIEEVAKHKKANVYTISCDIELDKSEFLGHHIVDSGKTVWVEGLLPKAMKEGAWFVFDELNMGKSEVFSSTHSVFDHRRTLTLKENNNEVIKAHKDFRIFATMNPNYAGTMELNFAFRRRWQLIIPLEYLNPEDEKQLLIERTGIHSDIADKLVKIGNDTRKMFDNNKINYPVSTAHLLEFAQILTNTKSEIDILECAKITLNTTDDKTEMEDILNVVRNYF